MKEAELYLTPSGERFRDYLRDMVNGELYRVEPFEKSIKELGDKMGLERMDMIKAYLALLEEF